MADGSAVLANLRQLPRVGVRIVDFTGGEPLLHPDLPRFLKEAKSLGLRTTVTTNGLLYPRLARDLRGLINLLHFSVDAAGAEVHDRLRGVRCFDRVMQSLDQALALGEKPELLFTATRDNFREVAALADLAKRLKVVLIVNPAFSVTGSEGILNADELQELIALCSCPFVYLNGGVVRLMLAGGNDPVKPRCRAVSSTVVISPRNELWLPCFHLAQAALPIAGDLVGLMRSPERKRWLQQQGRADFCAGCTINCYMAPSLVYRLDHYLMSFLPWAAKYFYYKFRSQPRRQLAERRMKPAA